MYVTNKDYLTKLFISNFNVISLFSDSAWSCKKQPLQKEKGGGRKRCGRKGPYRSCRCCFGAVPLSVDPRSFQTTKEKGEGGFKQAL